MVQGCESIPFMNSFSIRPIRSARDKPRKGAPWQPVRDLYEDNELRKTSRMRRSNKSCLGLLAPFASTFNTLLLHGDSQLTNVRPGIARTSIAAGRS